MKTGAVIAAAGIEEKPNDCGPMKKVGAITVIQRMIATLQQAEVEPIIVVTGAKADILEHHIKRQGVICIRNENFADSEMLDSARLGFAYIQNCCDQILFSPADIPLFTVSTVRKLIDSGLKLAVPMCEGKSGHPVLIHHQYLPDLLNYHGTGGLRQALGCLGEPVGEVQVEDKGALYETDMQEGYGNLLKFHNAQLFRPKFTLSLARETVFLDQTSANLLKLIEKTESVRTACTLMNLSYSKGWNLLNQMEDQLGYPVLWRHPGGMNGGHSELSPEGSRLLHNYEEFVFEVNSTVQELFKKIFMEHI